jgi:hypothetical protein
VEVLVRTVSTGTPTGPLESDREVGVCSCDANDLSDPLPCSVESSIDAYHAKSNVEIQYVVGDMDAWR